MGAENLGSRAVRGFMASLVMAAETSWGNLISMEIPSDQASEQHTWLNASPMLEEWTGPRIAQTLTDQSITIENKTFQATLEFLSDDIRRDKTQGIDRRVADLAGRYVQHRQKLISTLISNGTGDTSGLAYDGQYYFDDDHSEGASGTQKNLLTSSEVAALNVGTATAPTTAEAVEAVIGVISHIKGYLDYEGEPINEHQKDFVVMTGNELSAPFAAACSRTSFISGGAAVDNPLVNNNLNVQFIQNPRLSGWTENFVVFAVSGPTKPIIMQVEVPLEIEVIGKGSEYEKLNNKQLFGVRWSGNAGYGLWQRAAHATLS